MDAAVLNNLKKKVTEEFLTLFCKVRKGYKVDYEILLEEISFINLIDKDQILDEQFEVAIQYYLNNKWQIIQF